MTEKIHQVIRRHREQRGIGADALARKIGISSSEYQDLELHDDEVATVLPLKNARLLSKELGIDLSRLMGLQERRFSPEIAALERRIVISAARKKIGVSIAKMAEDIGFEEVFMRDIETDNNALEEYPFEVINILSSYLRINPEDILYAKY